MGVGVIMFNRKMASKRPGAGGENCTQDLLDRKIEIREIKG